MPHVADQSSTAENRAADELVQQLHWLFLLAAAETQTDGLSLPFICWHVIN
jgi:hypothetical protein